MIKKHKDCIVVPSNDELFPIKGSFKDIYFDQLIELYKDDDYIPYAEYLRTNFWQVKRLEILDRDNFKCQKCGAHETKNIKDKNGENILEWSGDVFISWADSQGNERISSLEKPQGIPDKSYNLQVHHKKYIINRLPWDYNDDDLITLCNYCHTEAHQNKEIPLFDDNGSQIIYKLCDRCNGTGYLPKYYYVNGGICFNVKDQDLMFY